MTGKHARRQRQRAGRESAARPPARPRQTYEIHLFGLHAVEAALANPERVVTRLTVTENAARRLADAIAARGLTPERARPQELDRLLGADTVHQGVVLETAPLPPQDLDGLAGADLVVVLDQVTDPHNVGAILRSAAAFGARGLVMTARHSPPLAGVTAKAACGALEHVPVVTVPNLARALARLGALGFERIGLDGAAGQELETTPLAFPLALVLGAEGKGLRRLTRESCDRLCRLRTAGPFASLNVSNAAAVALHAVRLLAEPGGR